MKQNINSSWKKIKEENWYERIYCGSLIQVEIKLINNQISDFKIFVSPKQEYLFDLLNIQDFPEFETIDNFFIHIDNVLSRINNLNSYF
jgi:hypothetical protein